MQLSNRQLTYNCNNSYNDIELNGSVQVNENGKITQLNGNLSINGEYAGDFWYQEGDGKINQSLNSIPENKLGDIYKLISTTILEIKSELTK